MKLTVSAKTHIQPQSDVCIKSQERLSTVHQRKGEAELAQLDWVVESLSDLKEGESVVSYVTSGDIDAVTAHLFTASLRFPRKEDGTFQSDVYVILPNAYYGITCTKVLTLLMENDYFRANLLEFKDGNI